MAAPVYATDLADISTAETVTNFTAIGGGGAIAAETDFFIQGSFCISKATQASWDSLGTSIGGVVFNFGSGVTIPSPGAFFAWIYWWGPGVLATFANGGARLTIGNLTTAFNEWNVKGVDDWIFGGWECAVVDPAAFSPDRTVGTPTSTLQYFGWEANVAATVQIGRGNPYGLDAMRYGRGELRITDGDLANGYATIDGASTYDNDNARRWGLLTPQNGAYFMQGLMVMGLAGTAVDMRDSNRVIFIKNTRRVAATFNGFEVRHASSNVQWTNISVQALGTVSRGFFTVTAGVVTLDTCTFTDMNTFTFLASTSALNCTFRRTNAVTAPGSTLTGSILATPTVAVNTSALIWDVNTNPTGLLDDTTFSKGTNAHHAIEFGANSPTSMTLNGIAFTGFSASQNNDASIFHIRRTTGTVTINLVGCSSDVSFATSYRTDGAAVVIVQNPVTFSVTAKNLETGAVVENARVMVPVTNGTNFPYQASVTITGAGTTATVAHGTHGLATNDSVLISGASPDYYNGVFTITKIDANSYSYTTPDTIVVSPATGTITATMVLLNGLTNASGVITDSRTYSGAQPVSGWVRKATGSPLYRQAPVADTVSSSNGLSVTVFLQPDE